ncbi:MAG: (2Fe-2S)-binding protein [Chloroflexi bacterium]|nr:(2Fe-2S)-binding protein [Chloroflexota bacterium]
MSRSIPSVRALAVRKRGPGKVTLRLQVNGEEYAVLAEPRRTLLDVLRKDLGLTGAKKVCDRGHCGACTVLVDGIPIYSCLKLAIECEGKRIETIEGLSFPDGLHPLQKAFIEHDAFQCGFCTPGQIMSLKALFDRNPHPSADEIRSAVAGNLCRCGAYAKILRAAQAVSEAHAKG